MKPNDTDRSFAGSIPQLYEQLMVPLIFEPYAADLAARAVARSGPRLFFPERELGGRRRLAAEVGGQLVVEAVGRGDELRHPGRQLASRTAGQIPRAKDNGPERGPFFLGAAIAFSSGTCP